MAISAPLGNSLTTANESPTRSPRHNYAGTSSTLRTKRMQTTLVYLHLTDAAQANAREKIEELFRRG